MALTKREEIDTTDSSSEHYYISLMAIVGLLWINGIPFSLPPGTPEEQQGRQDGRFEVVRLQVAKSQGLLHFQNLLPKHVLLQCWWKAGSSFHPSSVNQEESFLTRPEKKVTSKRLSTRKPSVQVGRDRKVQKAPAPKLTCTEMTESQI